MTWNILRISVLLVEDNEINCEIVEYILQDVGVEVVTANNGKAAVDAFASAEPGTFDCVLMDLMKQMITAMLILKESGKALFFIFFLSPQFSTYKLPGCPFTTEKPPWTRSRRLNRGHLTVYSWT